MSKGITVAPWRLIAGSGQTLTVNISASQVFANAVGLPAQGGETRAIYLSVITGNCAVRISKSGAAATATDTLIKATDPPLLVAVTPGDQVAAWGLAAGTLSLTELTQ